MNLAVLDHGLAVPLGELGGDQPVGAIERDRQRLKMGVSVGWQIECLQHPRPGALPPLPVEQPRARVTPPVSTDSVDLTAPQPAVKRLQHTEHVGAMVGFPGRELGV